ncbi:MAG: M1 family metallopeptidase [Flavobacteriales bacterium]|nr:M1 family metallopeptidase [Flavobacteriales bacterium]
MNRNMVMAMMSGLWCSPLLLCGQDHWQQQVDYRIAVRLDDVAHELHASEGFTYTNNSPHTLDTLWVHLWPNAYRDRHTALCEQMDRTGDLDLHFATQEERGWIDSLDFRTNGEKLTWGYHPKHGDIGWIKLAAPLVPGASTEITTPFRVKIPDGKFSRLGHTGQAYYITQWYPKPAVFDAQGWHAMPYLTLGEFYSEFGSFDVSITLPANYVVGATGVLDDPVESAWMDERAEEPLTMTFSGGSAGFPPSDARTKTLRFTQDRVHDFAWFADKRFQVRKSGIDLPRSGRHVTTWALFTPKNATLWNDAATYVDESVKHYSALVGEYPYDACTAVDGTISAGGGMEYPMVTIIGNMESREGLDNVIAHEVGHNWFYGILGSNERDHPWMDEGMNSFLELRYMRVRYPHGRLSIDVPFIRKQLNEITDATRFQSEMGYRLNARRNLDQPLSLTSDDYTEINYGTMVYMKTTLVFDHLLAYLGEEMMDRCMHAYFEEWKFKHPQPSDVRAVFERESGKDLTWVFGEMLRADGKLDASARKLKGPNLTIRSKGLWYAAPFPVTGWNGNDSLGTVWIEPDSIRFDVRSDPAKGATLDGHPSRTTWIRTETLPWPNADRIRMDVGNRTLDIDRRNNAVRSHGLFKRGSPLKFESLLGIEKDDHRSIYYALLPAWNGHDGFQAGLLFRNTTFPAQRTEWVLAPLYAFGSERLVGGARIDHHFDRMRSNLFQNIHLGVSGRTSSTFHDHDASAWYTKVSPSVQFDLKRDPLTRPWLHTIALRGVHITNTAELFAADATVRSHTEQGYVELAHTMSDDRKLHPTTITTTLTAKEDWVRGSVEVEQGFAYNARNKQLRLRAFAGTFLGNGGSRITNGLEAWGLSWGPEDMLYDHAYLERGATSGFTGRQYSEQQGGFKTPFLQGGSQTWLASMNLELDLPIPLPIALFASMGGAPVTIRSQAGTNIETELYFEGGIGLPVVKDVLEIWFPLAVSKRIRDEEEFLGRSVSDRIRFVIAFERMDPTRLLRNLKP